MTQTDPAVASEDKPVLPENFGPLRRLAGGYLPPYTLKIILMLVLMAVASAMTALFAKLIQPTMDEILVAGKAAKLGPIALSVLVIFTVQGLATYSYSVLNAMIAHGITRDLRHDLFDHLINADLAFFQSHSSGGLISRLVSDVTLAKNAIMDSFTGIGRNLLTLIFLVALMFWQNWVMSLAIFVIFPIGAFFVIRIGKKIRKLSRTTQDHSAGFSGYLLQIFQGIRHVKAYNREETERGRALKRLNDLRRLGIRNVRIGTLVSPFNQLLIGLAISGVILFGGQEVISGNMTPGQLMSFLAAFSLAYEPMKRLATLNNKLQKGLGAADRVFHFFDMPRGITSEPDAPPLEEKPEGDEIAFDQVSFQYLSNPAAEDPPALHNISFTAAPGTMTAIVGPSGAGKTTILNLIPRFYDVNAGQIRINGQDIRNVDITSLRSHIALVSQDMVLFDESVAENIAYSKPEASWEEIVEAARCAAAHEFILNLPQGYETVIGEAGTTLSGGQRQRLSLARAFLCKAPVLLLDEATSALDSASEKQIHASLENIRQDRTILIVAHRLSTIQNADRIIVMDEGCIREEGTHRDLIALKGLYAELWTLQAQKGQNAPDGDDNPMPEDTEDI